MRLKLKLKVLIGDFLKDGVFFRVLYRNLALLHLRVLLLPFIVLLQNRHTTLAENVEKVNKRPASNKGPPQISAQPQGPEI